MSPFVGNGMFIDLFQSVGHSHVSHIFLHRIARIFFPSSPVTFISSAGISSISGDFPLESLSWPLLLLLFLLWVF